MVATIDELDQGLGDSRDLLELAEMEDDEATVAEVEKELASMQANLEKLEFRRMFSGEMDENSAYLDIQAGSGGTEAQDWANMLLRMYLRWAESHGFKAEIIELSAGEVAGIKSATVQFSGFGAGPAPVSGQELVVHQAERARERKLCFASSVQLAILRKGHHRLRICCGGDRLP